MVWRLDQLRVTGHWLTVRAAGNIHACKIAFSIEEYIKFNAALSIS